MIKGHGNNPYETKYRICIDFSSNIAFNSKRELITEHIIEEIGFIHNYPDPEATELRERIAHHHNTNIHSVLITNGSAEAFYILAHYTAASKTAIFIPSFAEYEDACKLYNHRITYIESEAILRSKLSDYRTIWVGNPNNPDGRILPYEIIKRLCDKNSQSLIILDQAYVHLSKSTTICQSKGERPKNLIEIHSLTKAFAIPGLRLGYIIASPNIISKLFNMRPPWSVNSIALNTGYFIMSQFEKLLPDKDELFSESLFLQEELKKIEGIDVLPSCSNFFLSKIALISSHQLKEELIKRYGILIRDASNFRGLTNNHFRVAAQSRNKNVELIKAIQEILQEFK